MMDDGERALAEELYAAIQASQTSSARSEQAADFRVGISDLGYCSERLRRTLNHDEPDRQVDWLSAFAGHALGDWMEQAACQIWPDAIRQAEVSITLPSDDGKHAYRIYGHPDLLRPMGLLIDFKTDRGLEVPRRVGPSKQQWFQRHLYAKASWECGLFDDDVALDDVLVANVWMDRACDDKELHVDMEPFSERACVEAAEWLDEVVYRWKHDSVAPKEPPREVCEKTCGYFPSCRGDEVTVQGLLTDPTVVAAAAMYDEGLSFERDGRRLKDQAKAHLDGVSGSTGKFSVRWINIEGGDVAYTRQPSQRLQVKAIK